MKKICVITGTRADYGLLRPLIKRIHEDESLQLQIIATGMHLSTEFGLTYREIENDGFDINEKIEILLSSDSEVGITKSMGLALIGFADAFERLRPDMILILGDRFEAFAAASASMIGKIPIAHISGGETTEGAFDEAIRHSITKMSYIHFTSTEEYKNRVIQLGEEPSRVFNVGEIAVDSIKNIELLEKVELMKEIGFKFNTITALVTYHPVTLEKSTAQEQFGDILQALDNRDDIKIIFTKANADTDGRLINKMIDEYVYKNKHRAVAFFSLGQLKYFSTMKYVDLVIGNSSSGIVEAPYFGIPTVNIGDRQKGRIQAKSIINSKPIKKEVINAINKAISEDFKKEIKNMRNPYDGGDTSIKILNELKSILNNEINLKKKFYDL